jgi:outer membrane protein OmpA-like peptidoglycan-associated protein
MRHDELPVIAFGFRTAELTDEARAHVVTWAAWLAAAPGVHRVLGWCDPRGEHPGARPLAKARALAVHDALVAAGIPASRLRVGVRPSLTDGMRATLEPATSA